MKETNVKNTTQNESKILSSMEILKSALSAVIISFIVLCFFRLTVVNGQSMESSLYDGQKLLLCRTAYMFSSPERGDIVVVKPDQSKLAIDYIIKRVIALPGDTVEIKDNVIYVNDVALEEDYIKEDMVTADIAKFKLANNEYFICGDNRNNSLDSRSEILGPVTDDELFGKVVFNFSTFKLY
jgi:signal peptidase I